MSSSPLSRDGLPRLVAPALVALVFGVAATFALDVPQDQQRRSLPAVLVGAWFLQEVVGRMCERRGLGFGWHLVALALGVGLGAALTLAV